MIVLTQIEIAILMPEYEKYCQRCADLTSTKGRHVVFPMFFDDWWRATADDYKDNAKSEGKW